jgi:hypothetical protein
MEDNCVPCAAVKESGSSVVLNKMSRTIGRLEQLSADISTNLAPIMVADTPRDSAKNTIGSDNSPLFSEMDINLNKMNSLIDEIFKCIDRIDI